MPDESSSSSQGQGGTFGCELARVFVGDEPLDVAVHPMGYLLAVAFSDKLRLLLLSQ